MKTQKMRGEPICLNMKILRKQIDKIYNSIIWMCIDFLSVFQENQNDAEDLTQEVFIRVLNNLSNKVRITNLKTWIFSIAK